MSVLKASVLALACLLVASLQLHLAREFTLTSDSCFSPASDLGCQSKFKIKRDD